MQLNHSNFIVLFYLQYLKDYNFTFQKNIKCTLLDVIIEYYINICYYYYNINKLDIY